MTTPLIKNPRQLRLIKALMGNKEFSVIELQPIVGAINIPEEVRRLRKQGWIIQCTRIEVKDRDGKACRPGLYSLNPEHTAIAVNSLREYQRREQETLSSRSSKRKGKRKKVKKEREAATSPSKISNYSKNDSEEPII